MRTLKLAGLALTLSLILGAAGNTMAQTPAHQNQVWGLVRTADHSTMNIWDKKVVVVVRSVENDKPGPVVGTSKLKHGHYAVNMGSAAAGKYVVEVDPHGGDYQGGGSRGRAAAMGKYLGWRQHACPGAAESEGNAATR